MTREPELHGTLDAAIDETAQAMTAQAAPDLRVRVAARLAQPERVLRWWQPALAAAAVAAIVFVWWPAADVVTPPAATHVDSTQPAPNTGATATPGPVPPIAASRPARRMPADRETPWPTLDATLPPLEVVELRIAPLDSTAHNPIQSMTIEPMTTEPLEIAPLEKSHGPARR
jgi:hypothetical protein